MASDTTLPNALTLLTSSRPFLATEQRIVDFILNNAERAPQMTSAQLARASNTSEASVSRFCKNLGFKNYRSFQFSLARDLAMQMGDVELTRDVSLDDIEQSLTNIKHAKQREIAATLDALEPSTLRRVVNLFLHADLIVFAAVGNTNAVAIDAAIKFGQLGMRSIASTISENTTSISLAMHENDVLVLISNSGKSKRLERIQRGAKRSGATVILMCSDPTAPLARNADIVLRTVSYEALLTTADFSFSKIPATLLIEVIYNFLLPIVPNARDAISSYEELIQPDKEMD